MCVRCIAWLLLTSIALRTSGSLWGGEPEYEGKALSNWVMMTQGGAPESRSEAERALEAIGVETVVPFLVRWIKPPWTNSVMPGAAVDSFRVFGPAARSAIPELTKILDREPDTIDDVSAQIDAAKALSYLGRDAVPVLLSAAERFKSRPQGWEIIFAMANLGPYGAGAQPAILKWSKDPNEWVRVGALRAYVGIETNSEKRLSFARAALNDSSERVRRQASLFLEYVSGAPQ